MARATVQHQRADPGVRRRRGCAGSSARSRARSRPGSTGLAQVVVGAGVEPGDAPRCGCARSAPAPACGRRAHASRSTERAACCCRVVQVQQHGVGCTRQRWPARRAPATASTRWPGVGQLLHDPRTPSSRRSGCAWSGWRSGRRVITAPDEPTREPPSGTCRGRAAARVCAAPPDELLPLEGALHAAGFCALPRLSRVTATAGRKAPPAPGRNGRPRWRYWPAGLRARYGSSCWRACRSAPLALATAMQGAPVDGLGADVHHVALRRLAVPAHHWLPPLAAVHAAGLPQLPRAAALRRGRTSACGAGSRRAADACVPAAGAAVIGVPHLREHRPLRRSAAPVRRVRRRLSALALHARETDRRPLERGAVVGRLRTPLFLRQRGGQRHHMITID